MQAVYRTIESVAASRANIFITGESGTGKELAAEAVHKASPRAARPFVALNCGAIPRDLLESEIFGHVKGAFTGATDTRLGAAKAADGGTLFLDEIGEMPLHLQPKSLTALEQRQIVPVGANKPVPIDIRVIAATNVSVDQLSDESRFRQDLLFRLNTVEIDLPPPARAPAGHPPARGAFHRSLREEIRASRSAPCPTRWCRRWRPMTGPAMSARSAMPASGR